MYFFILCVCVSVCQKTTLGSWFLLSNVWVPGIELRVSVLAGSIFICLAILLAGALSFARLGFEISCCDEARGLMALRDWPLLSNRWEWFSPTIPIGLADTLTSVTPSTQPAFWNVFK